MYVSDQAWLTAYKDASAKAEYTQKCPNQFPYRFGQSHEGETPTGGIITTQPSLGLL